MPTQVKSSWKIIHQLPDPIVQPLLVKPLQLQSPHPTITITFTTTIIITITFSTNFFTKAMTFSLLNQYKISIIPTQSLHHCRYLHQLHHHATKKQHHNCSNPSTSCLTNNNTTTINMNIFNAEVVKNESTLSRNQDLCHYFHRGRWNVE